jgi:hypothetical protein
VHGGTLSSRNSDQLGNLKDVSQKEVILEWWGKKLPLESQVTL